MRVAIEYDVTSCHVYNTSASWQNVSDGCAGTDLRASRGAEELHDGYQQRFNRPYRTLLELKDQSKLEHL